MGCNCGKNKGRNLRVATQNKPDVSTVKVDTAKDVDIEKPVVDDTIREDTPVLDNSKNPFKNLMKAASTQSNKIKWFRDGANGIIKCLTEEVAYSDEDIQNNRDVCRACPYSTKGKGDKLTMTSQCMAINPDTGEVCGCFILCKTQNGECPLRKWTTIKVTIEKNEI